MEGPRFGIGYGASRFPQLYHEAGLDVQRLNADVDNQIRRNEASQGKMRDMEQREQRGFKGIWIPKEIWESDLPILAKVLFAEVDSLDNERGCYASNAYFAKFFGVTDRAIRKNLAILKEKNFITVSVKNSNERVISVQFKYSTKARKKQAKELDTFKRDLNSRFRIRQGEGGGTKVPGREERLFQGAGTKVPPTPERKFHK